ncbi:hypothetical protein M8J77_011564 [Diaphorina citri]|nr:hypothetical protein M8J77_011564 [Diaphorina citri]
MLGKLPKMSSTKSKMKMVNETEFDEFLSRISKTLYYGDKLVEEDHLSYPVIELAAEIYSDLKTGKSIDRLYLNEATEMTRKVKINPCYLVLALLYIERLKDCNSQYLDNVAPSQLFLISLVLASKFHDDSEYELSLSMFDKFQDWSNTDIFNVELEFLDALRWNVHVSEQEFYLKLLELEKSLAMKIGTKRNWITYTEMSTLMDNALLSQLTNLIVTVSAVCLTTYTAGVLTLVASSALASHVSTSAALAILSTTAQLSLLTPSTTNHSLYPNPNQEIEETFNDLLDEKKIDEMLRNIDGLNGLRGCYYGKKDLNVDLDEDSRNGIRTKDCFYGRHLEKGRFSNNCGLGLHGCTGDRTKDLGRKIEQFNVLNPGIGSWNPNSLDRNSASLDKDHDLYEAFTGDFPYTSTFSSGQKIPSNFDCEKAFDTSAHAMNQYSKFPTWPSDSVHGGWDFHLKHNEGSLYRNIGTLKIPPHRRSVPQGSVSGPQSHIPAFNSFLLSSALAAVSNFSLFDYFPSFTHIPSAFLGEIALDWKGIEDGDGLSKTPEGNGGRDRYYAIDPNGNRFSRLMQ